jgi:hypothetical protein
LAHLAYHVVVDSPATYDVAISFAGEDRDVAEELATQLVARSVSVFYDRFFQSELWGKDLYEHIADIYSKRATYCLMIVSRSYLLKKWTTHERKSAQARAFAQGAEYILPVRLDDTELPGLPSTIGYIDYRQASCKEIVDLLLEKLGRQSESGLLLRQEQLRLKRPAGMRVGCACGYTGHADNIYFCLDCETPYCRHCWWTLEEVQGNPSSEFGRYCKHCHGRVG